MASSCAAGLALAELLACANQLSGDHKPSSAAGDGCTNAPHTAFSEDTALLHPDPQLFLWFLRLQRWELLSGLMQHTASLQRPREPVKNWKRPSWGGSLSFKKPQLPSCSPGNYFHCHCATSPPAIAHNLRPTKTARDTAPACEKRSRASHPVHRKHPRPPGAPQPHHTPLHVEGSTEAASVLCEAGGFLHRTCVSASSASSLATPLCLCTTSQLDGFAGGPKTLLWESVRHCCVTSCCRDGPLNSGSSSTANALQGRLVSVCIYRNAVQSMDNKRFVTSPEGTSVCGPIA